MPLRSALAMAVVMLVSVWSAGVQAQGGNYGGGVIAPGSPPITLSGTSGGPRDAQMFGAQCRGSIAMTPDHIFNVTTHMRVHFEVIRASGDTTMVLVGPGGTICDDDGGRGTNPRIVRDLPPGIYQLFIGSYHQGQLLPYTIRVGSEVRQHTITVGRTHRGTFAPGLPLDGSGRAYADFVLRIDYPGQYQIDLVSPSSSAYDPYLFLLSGGRVIAQDDDGGGYPNSQIVRQLSPGVYTVRVSSYRRGQIARPAPFTLSVTAGATPPPPPTPPPPHHRYTTPRVIVPGTPLRGRFRPQFPIEPGSGRAYRDFTLTVSVPGTYQIDLTSANASTYDPYLRLLTGNGHEIASDDDGGGYPNSRITRHLRPGVYLLRVSSFRRGPISNPTRFNVSVTLISRGHGRHRGPGRDRRHRPGR